MRLGGGGGVTSTRNKRECAILNLKNNTKKSGNLHKIESQKSGNLIHKAFLLSENSYHPYKKIFDIKSTFQFYLFYHKILLFHFCFTMFVQRVFKFSSTAISLSFGICSAFQN